MFFKGVSVRSSLTVFRGGTLGALLALAACSAPSATGVGTSSEKSGPAAEAAVEFSGTTPRMRLMTREQYINTLAYLFGPDLRVDARFAPMRRSEGLIANGAASAGVSAAQLEQFQRTAALVSAAIVSPEYRSFLIPCQPKDENLPDPHCAAKVITAIGRLVYRKPLSAEKIEAFVSDANVSAGNLKGFYPGLAVALEGMLLRPEVLFITDTYEPDPRNAGKFRLDSYSIAQRLSFFLWNAAPDNAVLKAAESGEIQTEKGRARIVDMMLESPRLEVGMRAVFDDMMGLDRFNDLAKDAEVYPAFTGVTAADAREQTLRTIVEQLITKKRDYRDLYTTRETFITPSLAALYGTQAGLGWTRYEFPEESGRAGILTHISFLAAHAHPGRSSPTLRGKALRELLLCQPVPPPPANVDFSALEDPKSEHRTQRERVAFHLENPVCAGCHRITDPIGLSLELFDGAGVYRTAERGTPIDASGTLDGKAFKDTVGLALAVHDHPALTSCLVRRVFSYATGGAATRDDTPVLNHLNQRFAEHGYTLPGLLRTIALSPAFSRARPTPASEQEEKSAAAILDTAPQASNDGER